MKSDGLFPKIVPLPGTLHTEWRRCGKPTCRCASGAPHGPYAYRYWYEHGRRRKQYVPSGQVLEVRAAIARWRALHPAPSAVKRELAELRRLTKEARS